jgi:Lon protease-like protein
MTLDDRPGAVNFRSRDAEVYWAPPAPADLAREVADRMAAFYAAFYSEYLQHNDILEPLAQAMTIEYGRQVLAALTQAPVLRAHEEAE